MFAHQSSYKIVANVFRLGLNKNLDIHVVICYNTNMNKRLFVSCERKNLFGNDITYKSNQKDIMPTKGYTKPFVGINLVKNRKSIPQIFSTQKWIHTNLCFDGRQNITRSTVKTELHPKH